MRDDLFRNYGMQRRFKFPDAGFFSLSPLSMFKQWESVFKMREDREEMVYTQKEVANALDELQRIVRFQAHSTVDMGKCPPEIEAYWKGFESALYTFGEIMDEVRGKSLRELMTKPNDGCMG